MYQAVFRWGLAQLLTRMGRFSQKDFDALPAALQAQYPELRMRLEPNSRPLRERLDIEGWRQRLREFPRVSDVPVLAALDHGLSVLRDFPWQRAMSGPDNFAPGHLARSKRTHCLGKTYLLSQFLTEVGVAHEVATLPEHVALRLTLPSGRRLLADPTLGAWAELPTVGEGFGAYQSFPGLPFNDSYRDAGVTPVFQFLERDAGLMGELLNSAGFDDYMEWTYQNRADFLPQAESHFRRALEFSPTLYTAWQGLGKTLQAQGRVAQAREALAKALELNPLDTKSCDALSQILMEAGDAPGAQAVQSAWLAARKRLKPTGQAGQVKQPALPQ